MDPFDTLLVRAYCEPHGNIAASVVETANGFELSSATSPRPISFESEANVRGLQVAIGRQHRSGERRSSSTTRTGNSGRGDAGRAAQSRSAAISRLTCEPSP